MEFIYEYNAMRHKSNIIAVFENGNVRYYSILLLFN